MLDIMKELFYRFCRWALPLLGVQAFISCDNVINSPDMYGTMVAEYGVPVMEFHVKGKVVNSLTDKPVKGIAVTSEHRVDTVFTSTDGSFEYESAAFPDEKVKLKFSDVDKEENDLYLNKEVEVLLKKTQNGTGAWDYGLYVADDVVIKLDEEFVCEYGTPVVSFSVKGRVVDQNSSPLENIEVSMGPYSHKVHTEEDGSFTYSGDMDGVSLDDVTLELKDVDGEENGGLFKDSQESVVLKKTSDGDGDWNFGTYSAENVEIVMKK